MGKIGLLDLSVANLIAAGEVVDRPASVIKELMENAIDAGASEITVEIKNGGIALMRVSDNGCGMARDDAALCISRHATSKIRSAADLDGIVTLGFRGEALAAIASVSTLRIMTRQKKDTVGTMLIAECGQILSVEDAGCRAGTTIIVEDLFHNVPARRKFLKKDSSEAMAITAVVEKIALSHAEIAVRLIIDGQMKLQTAGDGKLSTVIYATLGREFASRMISVHTMSDGIEVTGYIGRPDNVRANRNYQNFFINGRYVKSRTAAAALEQAFSSYMESDKFPCCVLQIVIHPSFVDVNVHPTKLEVKFSNERLVFDSVYMAVRAALVGDTSRPEMPLKPQTPTEKQIGNAYRALGPINDRQENGANPAQTPLTPFRYQPTSAPAQTIPQTVAGLGEELPAPPPQKSYAEMIAEWKRAENSECAMPEADLPRTEPESPAMPEAELPHTEPEPPAMPREAAPAENESEDAPAFRILGTAFETYLLVEIGQKLLMIDKHAAHERILFEEMKKNLEAGMDRFAQILMLPIELTLSPEEMATAALYGKELEALGFAYTPTPRGVELRQIPGGISSEVASDLFVELSGKLGIGEGSGEISRGAAFEKVLYQASCKAAVKAHGSETDEQLRPIVEKLLRIPNLRYCPHGRPVAFEISKGSIEHQFKRS